MKPRFGMLTSLVTLLVSAWPTHQGMACACCSDPGMREEAVVKVTEFHRNQLRGLEFATEAELFMTDAGEDAVKGVSAVADNYQLTVKRNDKQWRLGFRTEEGKTGTLTLPIPAKLGTFQVDPRDGRKSTGGGPLLYKEWRWEGEPAADGIFDKKASRYVLILQGHGNRCDNGTDFSHWRLEVTGKDISYVLMGTLVQPEEEEKK